MVGGDGVTEPVRWHCVMHTVAGSILGHGQFHPLGVFSHPVERNCHPPQNGAWQIPHI